MLHAETGSEVANDSNIGQQQVVGIVKFVKAEATIEINNKWAMAELKFSKRKRDLKYLCNGVQLGALFCQI